MKNFPSTAELLISGADHRLRLDPTTGSNHYLCRPEPDPKMLHFGSSTASAIDTQGWKVANRFRNQLAQESTDIGMVACCRHHHTRICNTLKSICGMDDNTSVILTESGTSAHHLAAQMAQKSSPRALQAMIMQPSETGSGVPAALALDGTVPILTIPLRTTEGTPRPTFNIDSDVIQQSEQLMKQGASLLLVLVDGSKSGLTAPSLAMALELRQRFAGRIHLLLDGCQFRFDCATLRHYLRQDVMVAITGSKFLAGPSFSAALLLPGDNPAPSSGTIGAGLLVRWQVALSTLQTLQQQDGKQVQNLVRIFAEQVHQRLHDDPILSPLATPTQPQTTIFPFYLHDGHHPLPMAQTMAIYQQLQHHKTPKVQLGRPFPVSTPKKNTAIAALRLNLSAPLIIDAITNNHQHSLINQAMVALDRVQACARSQGIIH